MNNDNSHLCVRVPISPREWGNRTFARYSNHKAAEEPPEVEDHQYHGQLRRHTLNPRPINRPKTVQVKSGKEKPRHNAHPLTANHGGYRTMTLAKSFAK